MMKTKMIALLLLLATMGSFGQNLMFDVYGNYKHPVLKEKLNSARSVSDLIPYFPSNWIKSYNSVEVITTGNGVSKSAMGIDGNLNEDQLNLLKSAVLGTEIAINIKYQSENSLTRVPENGNMHYSATIVPDNEAEFAGGYEKLEQYIQSNAIDKISTDDSGKLQAATVIFTINEDGTVSDSKLSKSSGNPDIDQLLLTVVDKMPKWKPAENAEGVRVRQQFVLSVSGSEGC